MTFDPDALLAALPIRQIGAVPDLTPTPRLRWRASGGPYNGFSARERYQTGAVATWLQSIGCMAPPAICSICLAAAAHTHGEDYFAIETWIDICKGCHSVLHNRFHRPDAWARRLDRVGVDTGHWTRLVSPRPFDLAVMIKDRGRTEPKVSTFLQRPASEEGPAREKRAIGQGHRPVHDRRPLMKYGDMGIHPGARLVHPNAPELEVVVLDDRRLLWRGADHSLTSLTAKLTREFGLPASRDIWEFEGRSLGVIYRETWPRRWAGVTPRTADPRPPKAG